MMDMFYEKIVKRRKSLADMAYIASIILLALLLSSVAYLFLPSIFVIIIFGLSYLARLLISRRDIEYEYAVTNGDIDIDMIMSRRKRKRLFSASCKDFDVVARVRSDQYTKEIRETKAVEDYSSRNPEADVWFIFMKHNGKVKVILFEPEDRMIDSFKTFIPRKVFKD